MSEVRDLTALRTEYRERGLLEQDAADEPMVQFARWFDDVLAAGVEEPNAMTLATADVRGMPSARIVLLKGADARGFTFYTNYLSRKGRELGENPRAALVCFWPVLARQVRVEGWVQKVDSKESDAYFATRPRGSQLGAHASAQSEVIAGRAPLEARLAELERRFDGTEVPRPSHWGGYRLEPERVEFWQGRENRLHDRLVYRRAGGQSVWTRERLAP